MSTKALDVISKVMFVLGFASIFGSIAIWLFLPSESPEYAQRLSLFVGLWAPTFFILSGRFATQEVVQQLPAAQAQAAG